MTLNLCDSPKCRRIRPCWNLPLCALQIPNFLLAAPILALSACGCITYFRADYRRALSLDLLPGALAWHEQRLCRNQALDI